MYTFETDQEWSQHKTKKGSNASGFRGKWSWAVMSTEWLCLWRSRMCLWRSSWFSDTDKATPSAKPSPTSTTRNKENDSKCSKLERVRGREWESEREHNKESGRHGGRESQGERCRADTNILRTHRSLSQFLFSLILHTETPMREDKKWCVYFLGQNSDNQANN